MNKISTIYKSLIFSVISLTLILVSSQTLFGKNYYFSTSSGDDTRTSTQAQNIATPWKTIAKLNSFFSSLNGGDSVLFRRGDTFTGKIVITKSGIAGSPITIGAYGTGEDPIISGFTTVSSWTNLGSNIWESTGTISTKSAPNMVTINGVSTPLGRYPNSGWNTIGTSTSTSITDAALGAINWTGAEIVMRKQRWVIDRNKITSQSGSTLNFVNNGYSPQNGWGYFIQNDQRTLDQQNEWYFNTSTKKISIYSAGIPTNVQVATTDTLVAIFGKNYITFDNLSFLGANKNAFIIGYSLNITIQNCNINFSGDVAIFGQSWGQSSANIIIKNNSFKNTTYAVKIPCEFTNAYIGYNTFKNSGVLVGMNGGGDGQSNAIFSQGSNSTIEYNTIDSTGYIGIHFDGDNTKVQNNFITNFFLLKDDGGGIYTYNNSENCSQTHIGKKIINNILINGKGNNSGALGNYLGMGIYLDGQSSGIEVRGNTVVNCNRGLFFRSLQNVQIVNNTSYNNLLSQVMFSEMESTIPSVINSITFTDNILFAKEISQYTAIFNYLGNYTATWWTTLDKNYYARPIDDNTTIETITNNWGTYSNKTLAQWQLYSSLDANSKKSPKTITTTDDIRFEYNATKFNKIIPLTTPYLDVKGTTYTSSITLLPFTSVVLIKSSVTTGCNATGNISYQVWNNIGTSTAVSDLTNNSNYPNNPSSTSLLTSMEAPSNLAESFGGRIAGYICAPISGSYTFWIASDDNSELWLSTNDQPANKQKIAYHTGWTNSREWNKYPTQKSAIITLTQGKSYYIEALMKDANGGDNLAVGWLKPGQTGSVPSEIIPGTNLSPINNSLVALVSSVILPSTASVISGATITLSATVLPSNTTTNTLNWTSSNSAIATVNSSGVVTGISVGTATITALLTDGSNQSSTCVVTVNPIGCNATGSISYQVWNNIGSGTAVSNLTSISNYPNNPTSTSLLTSMEAPSNLAESFGGRIVGYICAPMSGNYTFWVASDDNSELWLSTNDQPANKQKIAYHTGWTNSREWNKYPTQKSAIITLTQGKSYYIEALMKDGNGADNFAVGWLKPGQTGTSPSEIIPGAVLSPINNSSVILISSVTLPPTSSVISGAGITLSATILPGDATTKTLIWTSNNSAIATVNSSGVVTGVSVGTATITALSTDGSNKSGTCVVSVNPIFCNAIGNISYQVWNNIGSGILVSNLTSNINYPNNPTSTSLLTSMEAPSNLAESFGGRIVGYICAPMSGSYTFWIASDDNSELWLSTNDQPANKQKIAYHTGWTNSREWNKYPTQKSAIITLTQGKSYYIEALMKDGNGADNFAVGWLKPGQTGTSPSEIIPGAVLSPLVTKSKENEFDNPVLSVLDIKLLVYPNPLNSDQVNIKIENFTNDATLNIYSISGILLHEEVIHSSETIHIDRSVFTSGIYIVKIFNNEFVKTTKLIVK